MRKFVIPELESIDHTKTTSEIITTVRANSTQKNEKSPSPIQFLTIENTSNLVSPSHGSKTKTPIALQLLPSSEKTPKGMKNVISPKTNMSSQPQIKPKMIFQSLNDIISDKENTASKSNECSRPQTKNQKDVSDSKKRANIQDLKSVSKRL